MLSPEDAIERAHSVGVLYEYAQNFIQEQNKQADALDTKASFVLGSASLLTAGVGAFQQAVGTAGDHLRVINASFDQPFRLLVSIATAVAITVFFVTVVCAYNAYRLRKYATVGKLRALKEQCIGKSEDYTKYVLLDTLISSSESNRATLRKKAQWTRRAVVSLLIQAAAVAALIGLQTWVLLTT